MNFRDLTIIVGKNNAGKSTVVEALRLISVAGNKARTMTKFIRPSKILACFKINIEKLKIDLRTVIYFYEEELATITAVFKDRSKIILFISKEEIFACFYDKDNINIKSKNNITQCDFGKINILPQIDLIKENEKLLSKDTVIADKETYLTSRHFRNELLLYREHFNDFRQLAETTWPGLKIRNLSFNSSTDEYISFLVDDAGFPAELGIMGSGIQMWLQIVWFICRSIDCETIILDEPDVYMHPDLQRKLIIYIKRRFKQIIIATHSIEIISEVEPKNIITINKATKCMKYADDKKAVQNIIDSIGSVHNLSLVRLANAKKCLFIEGDDLKSYLSSIVFCILIKIFHLRHCHI